MTRPYYQDDFITLYLGSCLQVEEWLAGNVLVSDPPYGIGGDLSFQGNPNGVVHESQGWDDDLLTRDAALTMWGDRPRAVFGSPRRLDAAPEFRGVPLVWDKGDIVAMGDTSFPWRPTYELIYVAGEGWSGHRGESILRQRHRTNDARDIGHPSAKPVALMEAIIRKAPPGVVVDPFAGSCATLIAARNLGRRAIGVEVSEEFAAAGVRRIQTSLAPLFDEGDLS